MKSTLKNIVKRFKIKPLKIGVQHVCSQEETTQAANTIKMEITDAIIEQTGMRYFKIQDGKLMASNKSDRDFEIVPNINGTGDPK